MVTHKYAVGDRVRLTLERHLESNPSDIHTIARRLPVEANVCQYRVKRASDGQERTVSEDQIAPVRLEGGSGDLHAKAVQAQQDLQRRRNMEARLRGSSNRNH